MTLRRMAGLREILENTRKGKQSFYILDRHAALPPVRFRVLAKHPLARTRFAISLLVYLSPTSPLIPYSGPPAVPCRGWDRGQFLCHQPNL